jgi:hypothetical protein
VTAFVASLVLALVALTGFWLVQVIPFALAAYVLLFVPPEVRRGRTLAGWAAGIALASVGLSMVLASHVCRNVQHIGAQVMAALASDGTPAERDVRLKAWVDPKAVEGGALDRILKRFAVASEVAGPYVGPVEAGSFLTGFASVVMPPAEKHEIGAQAGDTDLPRYGTLWVRARFKSETLHVALVLNTENPIEMRRRLEATEGGQPAPVIRDVRFYRSGGADAPR